MPKLPQSWFHRHATLQRTMLRNTAAGRTSLVAPQPRPLEPLDTASAGGLPADWSVADADSVTSDSDMKFLGTVRLVDPLADSFILIDPTFSVPYIDGQAPGGEEFQLVASSDQASFELDIATGDADLYTGAVGGDTTSFVRVGAPAGTGELMATDDSVYLRMTEGVDPGAPSAGDCRLFAKDNGSGKMQLCVRFPSGATQVLATEP